MRHDGGCHCGNIRVSVWLTRPAAENALRECQCSFCRAHATRTVSDPGGLFEIWADDWSLVEPYRFDSRTAEYLLCRRCGVYIGALADTPKGPRAVINTNCLTDRATFTQNPFLADRDGETVEARLARRTATWTPTFLHRPAS